MEFSIHGSFEYMSLCESEQKTKSTKLDKHVQYVLGGHSHSVPKQIYPGLHMIWQTAFNTLFKHLKFIYFQSSRESISIQFNNKLFFFFYTNNNIFYSFRLDCN